MNLAISMLGRSASRGGPVEPRTIKGASRRARRLPGSSTLSKKESAASAMASTGWCIVVSPGGKSAAPGMSSNPTTDKDWGTGIAWRCASARTPRASRSVVATTAVGRSPAATN